MASEEEILGCMSPYEEVTVQEMMRRLQRSYKPTYFSLMELAQKGILVCRKVVHRFFRLNLSNPLVRKHLEMEELKRREQTLQNLSQHQMDMVNEMLKQVDKDVPLMEVLLTKAQGSELSFLFVLPTANGYVSQIADICTELNKLNGVRLRPLVASLDAFRKVSGTFEQIPTVHSPSLRPSQASAVSSRTDIRAFRDLSVEMRPVPTRTWRRRHCPPCRRA